MIVLVAAGAFVATNIDNLVLLVLFLLRYRDHRVVVGAAYLVCLFLLGLVGFLISLLANFAPVQYLGLLGFIPITIGAVGILSLVRGTAIENESPQAQTVGAASIFAVTLSTQLGNGADTMLTFGSLFGDSAPGADYLIMLTVAAMAVLFWFLANYLVNHPALSELMQRYAQRVTPFLLILVGLYILANTAADLAPG